MITPSLKSLHCIIFQVTCLFWLQKQERGFLQKIWKAKRSKQNTRNSPPGKTAHCCYVCAHPTSCSSLFASHWEPSQSGPNVTLQLLSVCSLPLCAPVLPCTGLFIFSPSMNFFWLYKYYSTCGCKYFKKYIIKNKVKNIFKNISMPWNKNYGRFVDHLIIICLYTCA